MPSLKNVLIFLLFFIAINKLTAQDSTSLANILEFTSNDKFIANNVYKIYSKDFSLDGSSIELLIEGDISSKSFSFAIISMIPALQNSSVESKKIDFKYLHPNDKNSTEASVIEAVKSIYPEKLLEYLLLRAEYSFTKDWQEIAINMSMDTDLISNFSNKPVNIAKVMNMFNSRLINDYRIFVNNIEFNLIPRFFSGLNDPRVPREGGNTGVCCNSLYCLSECLYAYNYDRWKDNKISDELFFSITENITNPDDIYLTLSAVMTGVGCSGAALSLGVAASNGFANPIADVALVASLAACGYNLLSVAVTKTDCSNDCNNNPCTYEEGALLYCEEGQICTPIQRVHILQTNSVTNQPNITSEEYLECRDCPTGFSSDSPFNDVNIDFEWELDLTETPLLGGYSKEMIAPTINNSLYDYNLLFDNTILLSINDFDLVEFPLGNAGHLEQSINIESFLVSGDVEIGDELCIAILPANPIWVGPACYEEECFVLECPKIDLVVINGDLVLNVENFNKFQWPDPFLINVPGFIEDFEIKENVSKILGPIETLGCYNFALDYNSGTVSNGNPSGVENFFNECFNQDTQPEECGQPIVDCYGLCVDDPCDLKVNDLDLVGYTLPNSSIDINFPNGSINILPYLSSLPSNYEILLENGDGAQFQYFLIVILLKIY